MTVFPVVFLVSLLTFLHYIAAQMRGPILPLYAAAHGATPTWVGLAGPGTPSRGTRRRTTARSGLDRSSAVSWLSCGGIVRPSSGAPSASQ